MLVHDGAGVTAHRWLKVAIVLSNLVKATFSHHRTASAATTVTPTTNAPPEPRCPSRRAKPKPFVWTKTAEEILDSLARYISRISDGGH